MTSIDGLKEQATVVAPPVCDCAGKARSKDLLDRAQGIYAALTTELIERNITISTMESCTAGLLASLITDTDGSSQIFKGSFVTYSNDAKIAQGVPAETIETYGVYSSETAIAMASACRSSMAADIGIGVTGSLGTADPNNTDSIPGEVFYAIDFKGNVRAFRLQVPNQGSKFLNKASVAHAIAADVMNLLG